MTKAKVEKKVEVPKVEKEIVPVGVKEEVKPVATGKFYVDNRPDGARVIGKEGQVVSNLMPVGKANRLADHMNNRK